MDSVCSICLDTIKDSHATFTLSCNHVFHFTCFKKLVYKTDASFFIDCPNCRQLNTRIDLPFDNGFDNLKALCCSQVGKERCLCHTRTGRRCKHKSYPLNYGKCYSHNNGILPREKCHIVVEYIVHLLQSTLRTWTTKLYMIDAVKKLVTKYDDIQSLQDIYRYLFMYIAYKQKIGEEPLRDQYKLYDYYELEYPPKQWASFCIEKRVLF